MNRLPLSRVRVYACIALSIFVAASGMTCPGDGGDLSPEPPPGNRPPRIYITSVAPTVALIGAPIGINITGEDAEDAAVARVFASTSDNPTTAEEVAIQSGIAIGPGESSTAITWDTSTVNVGSYNIFAEIDDRTFNPDDGTGNAPVRVVAASKVTITPPGTEDENTPPALAVDLPSIDIGLSNNDQLTISFVTSDAESDTDTLTITYLFDRDRDPSNDSTQPPIIVGADSIAAGTLPPGSQTARQTNILIDLAVLPFRSDTDELGRPLPYFVRVQISDGAGGVVNGYASGAVQLLASASGVIDLLAVGGRTAGATFQGFGGTPVDARQGDRAGSAFAPLGDLDGDGLDDFAIVAETASPFGLQGVGQVYSIYGRARRIDASVPNAAFTQGRFSGVLSLNTVGSWIEFPPSDPRFRDYFKIRGNAMPDSHESNSTNNTLGITSVVAMPDLTGDLVTLPGGQQVGRPEMFAGAPYNQDIIDVEDLDPCDTCSFPTNEIPGVTLFTDVRVTEPDAPITGQIANINAQTPSGVWVPGQPGSNANLVNVVLNGLNQTRILDISGMTIVLSGRILNTPNDQPANMDITVQFEDMAGYSVTFAGILTQNGGNFSDLRLEIVGGLNGGPLDPLPVGPAGKLPPSVYDGRFGIFVRINSGGDYQINSASIEILGTLANTLIRPITFAYNDGLPLPLSGNESCPQVDPQPLNAFSLQSLASSFGDSRWKGVAPPPFNNINQPFALRNPGTPIYNEVLSGHRDDDINVFPGVGANRVQDDTIGRYESGLVYMMASNQLVLGQGTDGTWDRSGCPVQPLGQFGQEYGDCLNDAIRGARFRGAWYSPDGVGDGLGVTGGLPVSPYEPNSLFGYTVDTMPDLNGIFSPTGELVISAPAASSGFTIGLSDLTTALQGVYNSADPSRNADFDVGLEFSRVTACYLTIVGTGVNMPRVRLSLLDNNGDPIPGADSMLQFWSGADLNGNTIYANYFGDSSQGSFPRTSFLINGQQLRLPGLAGSDFGVSIASAEVGPILTSGVGKVRLEVLPNTNFGRCCVPAGMGCDCLDLREIDCYEMNGVFDAHGTSCSIQGPCGPGSCLPAPAGPPPLSPEEGAFPVRDPEVTITQAFLTIEGTGAGRGNVWIIEGQDYSADTSISNDCNASEISTGGDTEGGENRPMSWPSSGCDANPNPNIREFCYPQNLAWLAGELGGDAFGWAHFAGDTNFDAVPDLICGSPLADSVAFGTINSTPVPPLPNTIDLGNCPPQELGANKRTNNGKVFLIYGTPTLQNGAPCLYERFEIRGSHDEDQFGRVQGNASDFNGDSITDVFFAAERYDAIDNIAGDGVNILNKGIDAGFVGVMFGRATGLTGEIAVNCERIGTSNFPGVKFIGGSAGVRLGGSQPSRSNQLFYPDTGFPINRYKPLIKIIENGQHGVSSAGDYNQDGLSDILMTAPGQKWPAASVEFNGPVADGATITVFGASATRVFEFDVDGVFGATNIPVQPASLAALDAQEAFYQTLVRLDDEGLNAAGVTSRTNFPEPLPDTPTVRFVGRTAGFFNVTTTSPVVGIELSERLGVAYLIFGNTSLLNNKTFYLPDDINRRVSGNRVLKGMIMVSPYERNTLAESDTLFDPLETPDEAPIEAVSRIGDVDGDGFPDIIVGAPQADLINIVSPDQRRQSSGEAYLIYGNQVGLNAANAP